ncbi:hypothetical protein [Flavicella marina]|uniref:hypothetical protein n=1 Tax=Flavicella marina TaxID=1475951 RepID=UPI001264CD8D|nr:hypothetical protein [Flavicella marina]
MKLFLHIISLFFLAGFTSAKKNTYTEVKHTVIINHPGEKHPLEITLTEVQDINGLPIQYHTNVESVICLEEVCKIIPVKIYWNAIGDFQKYELKPGATLEKYEADLFEKEDYTKLQSILGNKKSPFKEVRIDEVLTIPDEHGDEDIDGVSGATALELNDEDTVQGAALTCYTLWHWANGDLIQKIQEQTGKSSNTKQLENYTTKEDKRYFEIAIREFTQRKLFNKTQIEVVISKIQEDHTVSRTAFKYLEKAPIETCMDACEKIFLIDQKEQTIAAIQFMLKTNLKFPVSLYNHLSDEIDKLHSYQEVSLFLDLMEIKNANSKHVINNIFPLLENNFLIARRAFWFLSNQNIDKNQKTILDSFKEKNKERL